MEQLSSPGECEVALLGGMRGRAGVSGGKGARGRGSAWGSISRVFARSRHRTKSGSATASGHESGEYIFFACSSMSWNLHMFKGKHASLEKKTIH